MLQEWFHFVDKEKQVRIRIDGKVNQMIAEAAELKHWTISEVIHVTTQSMHSAVAAIGTSLVCSILGTCHSAPVLYQAFST